MPTKPVEKIGWYAASRMSTDLLDKGPSPMTPTALPTPVSARDVADVEAYVSDTVADLGLPTGARDSDWLIQAGIATVVRVDRAMPPERPLRPMLESHLSERLLALWRERSLARASDELARVA